MTAKATKPVMPNLPNMPVVNVEALVAAHGKNMEAFAQAGKIVAEGAQAVSRRQAEIVQDHFKTMATEVETLMKGGPKFDLPVDKAKTAYQTAMTQAEELYGIGVKAQKEAFEVLNARALASIDEISKSAA